MMPIVSTRGNKHTCAGCATRFYDLQKLSPTCPACGKKVTAAVKTVRRTRRPRNSASDEPRSAASHAVAATGAPKAKRGRWK